MTKVFATRVKTKVVNTVLVPAILASMYRTGMCTDIKTLTFCTGLNTSRTGHVPAILVNFGQYRQVLGVSISTEKSLFLFFFKFCNF